MVNKAKIKGSGFERKVVDILNTKTKGKWKRVVGSGAIGTTMGESSLCGDVVGEISGFKKFRAECKTGYNNSKGKEVKQFTLKKEWLDKIKLEAQNTYSFPFLAGHFDNATSGVKNFIVMDIEDFIEMLNLISDNKKELDLVYEKIEESSKTNLENG